LQAPSYGPYCWNLIFDQSCTREISESIRGLVVAEGCNEEENQREKKKKK
jgi:hypothetical protein